MKNKITLAFLCLSFICATFAQEKRSCGSMTNLEYMQSKDPSLKDRMEEIERFTQRKILEKQKHQGKIDGEIITIPVVVHIIYNKSEENISLAQIQSQIDVLNEDFRRTNADADNKWAQAADTQIEFKLATIDVNGNPTTGITRKYSEKTSWEVRNSMKKSSEGGVDPWDTSQYLNMWVCNIGPRLLGYAQFPGGNPATDGVVMRTTAFGSSDKGSGFYLSAPFDKGRTTTHEIGHFLNLRHIWGDGDCGVDDFVADTPQSDSPNYNCASGHESCGSLDMIENYMDYSDDACMNLFTLGQKNRMRAVLEAGGVRRALALSDKADDTGVCNATVPLGISIAGVTPSEASVTWTAIPNATYDVRYKAVSSTSWTMVNAVETVSATLHDLDASTTYEVQVRSKCPSQDSAYSASVNFTTEPVTLTYCESKSQDVSGEYIKQVILRDVVNNSTAGDGYSDHTSISINLPKGKESRMRITPHWTGTIYNEGFAVFIDYNQDGDFYDEGETVWTKERSKEGEAYGEFIVPESAKMGATRMRVSMKYDAIPTPCEAIPYGEVEDYTVVIKPSDADVTPPSAPRNLTVSDIKQTSVVLNWEKSSDDVAVTGYDVYQGTRKLVSTQDRTLKVNNLLSGANYNFSVKAKDAAGNISAASRTVNVTTLVLSYCTSKGTDVSYEWIDYVAFANMKNYSGPNEGYGDFTSQVATVTPGTRDQLVVRAGYTDTAYNEFFTVWIDYNQDGDFYDAGEMVAQGNSTSKDNRILTIDIPYDAKLGSTRMRVSMKYQLASGACESNIGAGEVEDYTVNITNSNTSARNAFVAGEVIGSQKIVELMAYPNPSKDFIQVKVASKSLNMTYKIVNTIGRVMQYGRLDSSRLNISALNTGVYILEVNDGQKVLKTRVVKE